MVEDLYPGCKVTFVTEYRREKGIVKSFRPDGKGAFVVYHCNNDWKNYKNYTGAGTSFQNLVSGWDEDIEIKI